MDYRASSTAALSKKLGSSTGSTSIYDGVFSGSAPFRGSTFSSRVDDFGEIFNGGGDSRRISSIPVLDVPALRERKVAVDARSSRLEYANIFGGSGVSDGVASYEDLPAESRKMRTFNREERTRVGTRSPSEVSFSGSEDSQVLPHSSDKAKKFNLSYNRSNLGSKDGTNGTTHVTQLHDVPGFARVIDGTDIASARDGDEKAKLPVFGSTPEIFGSTPEKSHKNVDQNVSPSNGYGTPSPSRFFTNNFNSKDVEASPSKVSVPDGGEGNFDFSPSYFDEELDANSAAAASAAAVRKAIDQAQEKIKIAKEIMERRKDMFQGNSYFNGSGAGKRKEAKKAKKVIKFSEMEENAEPNRFAPSHLMNIEDISGQTLELIRAETRAQPCVRERDSMDGDEANEMRTLVKKIEIEKKTDDYVMQKTVTAELSSEVSMESEARGNLENSNLPATIVGYECDVYGDDHESAEQLHYLEENKEEFEVEYEEQSEENVEVDNGQRQCEDELQELRDSEVEKKFEDQSMDCVWEEIVKKPKETKNEEEEEDEGNVEREKECLDRLDSGKNLEDDGKEFDGFHLGDESKELNADAKELLEKSDCLLDGEEEQEQQHREEDNYSEMQQDAFDQQMEEEEEIQTKIDLQTEVENQEIHSYVDKSDNELESSVESSENQVANNSDDLEEKDLFDQQFEEEEEIQTKIDLQTEAENQEIHVPSNVDRSDNELESSVESSENLVANNSDDLEQEEVTDSSSLDKKHKVVNESTSEEARGLGTFRLSWGSLSVSEITGLNENTVKLGFPDVNIGQWQNVEEPKNVQNADETETVPVGDNEGVREETSSSSSGKEEAEAFINQEDEFSEYDDSLVDSEVNIEADWQPDMFEKKEEMIEAKSDQSSDQGDEKSDSFLEPQRDSIKKTEEDKTEECLEKTEEEREKEKERERKRELEKERIAVDRAIREARERAFAEARERAERAAVEKATAEARQRMAAHAREKMAKTEAAAVNERRSSEEARIRAQRAAVERATAEARERALEKALSEKLSGIRKDGKIRQRSMNEPQQKSSSSTTNTRNSSSSSNGAPQSGERYGGANDESAQRSKARLERHQRTAERAAKALAEKNMRDLLAQREQVEKNRLAEALDADIKRWSSGKHGNLRALLSTLQYILGAESGWQAVSLTEIVTSAAVKKAYRKATLCVHPDKLQQRGASLQQKYICEKVFDLLKEAWNRFSAEEK